MENELRKVVKNTSAKAKYQLVISGTGSRLTRVLSPEISARVGYHLEVAFGSLETYYSFPNIDDTNNVIRVTLRSGAYKTFTIGKGCYSLVDIDTELQVQFKDAGIEGNVKFYPNYNTMRCRMVVAQNTRVDFAGENSLRSVLGFEGKVYGGGSEEEIFDSERIVDIMKVNSILVHCDLVNCSYVNEVPKPVIHSFFPDAVPGAKIVERPSQYNFLSADSDIIRSVSVWLTDDKLLPLDLQGEVVTVTLFLREFASEQDGD